MSTPPFEITGNTEGSAGASKAVEKVPDKQLKEIGKTEKNEKLEHKEKFEKNEKPEHKEKPEKIEFKEKPEKFEHKEKPEKFEHKEKPEKFEHKEKPEVIEHVKYVLEGPPDPEGGGEVEQELLGRVARLEQTVGQLQHFITTNLRPDLSKGALKQEPEAGSRKG